MRSEDSTLGTSVLLLDAQCGGGSGGRRGTTTGICVWPVRHFFCARLREPSEVLLRFEPDIPNKRWRLVLWLRARRSLGVGRRPVSVSPRERFECSWCRCGERGERQSSGHISRVFVSECAPTVRCGAAGEGRTTGRDGVYAAATLNQVAQPKPAFSLNGLNARRCRALVRKNAGSRKRGVLARCLFFVFFFFWLLWGRGKGVFSSKYFCARVCLAECVKPAFRGCDVIIGVDLGDGITLIRQMSWCSMLKIKDIN